MDSLKDYSMVTKDVSPDIKEKRLLALVGYLLRGDYSHFKIEDGCIHIYDKSHNLFFIIEEDYVNDVFAGGK